MGIWFHLAQSGRLIFWLLLIGLLLLQVFGGGHTHGYPITVELARELGLPVTIQMPRIVYELMDLYPQANARRPSVVYVPTRQAGDGKSAPFVPVPALPTPASSK